MINFILFTVILLVYALVYNVIVCPEFISGIKRGLKEFMILFAAAVAIAWIAVLFL